MQNKINILCHSENDAMFVINSLTDTQLMYAVFIVFVDYISYTIFYDSYSGFVSSTCYPYAIKANTSLQSCFQDAVFAIYHYNFL